LVLLNTLTFVAVLVVNYLGSTGTLNGQSVADVSHRLDSLFTPADYAFSIWGFIYLWLAGFVAFQWYSLVKKRDEAVIEQCDIWFMLANVFNGMWVLAWVNNLPGLALAIMLALLFSLVRLVQRFRMEMWDAPVRIIVFVWWPISWYIGWIITATLANAASFLTSMGWNTVLFTPVAWTVIMVVVATLVYLMLIRYRNMREAALVGVWALVAIANRQWGINHDIALTAVISAAVLFVAAAAHGYNNRHSTPVARWMNREGRVAKGSRADP